MTRVTTYDLPPYAVKLHPLLSVQFSMEAVVGGYHWWTDCALPRSELCLAFNVCCLWGIWTVPSTVCTMMCFSAACSPLS